MNFRPCPSYPGYEASPCGTIRSMGRPTITKSGKVGLKNPRVLKRAGQTHVMIVSDAGSGLVHWRLLVRDAWAGIDERPESDFPDGRVITLAEHIAELLVKASK